MGRALLIVLGLLIVGVGAFAFDTAQRLGVFREIEPHFDGDCALVQGAIGTEDLALDPRTGAVYVSSFAHRTDETNTTVGGAIYRYDPAAAAPELVRVTPGDDPRFRPHGISLWTEPDGSATLFVINHPAPGSDPAKHTIEVLDVPESGPLTFRESLRDPDLLVMPNDIAAVGPDRFYLTNTHANPPGLAQQLETWLRLSRARIVFYDGSAFSTALEGHRFPNGIAVSPDGRTLYIAETSTGRLWRYARDPASETLSDPTALELESGLDNLDVDPEGDVWVGAHPKLLQVLRTRSDPNVRSPSQALRVRADGRVEEVYLNGGDQISGVSVAIARGGHLFLGQIFDDGILDCRLDPS